MLNPMLIIMVGLPGSGKTTFASTYGELLNAKVHSSDDVRQRLYGDSSIQGDPKKVFKLLQKETLDTLNSGVSAIYDATNLTRWERKEILSIRPPKTKALAVVMDTPFKLCLERNNTRERVVPEEVMIRLQRKLEIPKITEGFVDVLFIDPEGKMRKEAQNL